MLITLSSRQVQLVSPASSYPLSSTNGSSCLARPCFTASRTKVKGGNKVRPDTKLYFPQSVSFLCQTERTCSFRGHPGNRDGFGRTRQGRPCLIPRFKYNTGGRPLFVQRKIGFDSTPRSGLSSGADPI